jgi:hypothetical protein
VDSDVHLGAGTEGGVGGRPGVHVVRSVRRALGHRFPPRVTGIPERRALIVAVSASER